MIDHQRHDRRPLAADRPALFQPLPVQPAPDLGQVAQQLDPDLRIRRALVLQQDVDVNLAICHGTGAVEPVGLAVAQVCRDEVGVEQLRRLGRQQGRHLGRQVLAQQRRGHPGLVHQRPEEGVMRHR